VDGLHDRREAGGVFFRFVHLAWSGGVMGTSIWHGSRSVKQNLQNMRFFSDSLSVQSNYLYYTEVKNAKTAPNA
jgi:hypothetical protein